MSGPGAGTRGRPCPPSFACPPAPPGLRVGLFGGSFNPPHEGHLLVAETAIRRLRLDRLWWIVTPGNPLKNPDELRPLAERVRLSKALAKDPRIVVTAFEAAHGVRYTADALALVRRRRPGVRFVWVMGADALGEFHRWRSWRQIVAGVPLAVVDRPGSSLMARSAPAARRFAAARVREAEAASLPFLAAPAWVFLHGQRSRSSSTALRASAPAAS